MPVMDHQRDNEPHVNANPFGSTGGEPEDENWARNVASAGAGDSSVTTSPSLSKTKTEQSNDEHHLAPVTTIRSAAHRAKERMHLHSVHATGASKFFNPTAVHVHVKWKDDDPSRLTSHDSASTKAERAFLWRSRDNRKGRGSVAVPTSGIPTSAITSPSNQLRAKFEFNFKHIAAGIWKMCTTFAYWDMAFWSGWAYAIGSVLFVIDGSWSFKDVLGVEEDPNLVTYGGPLCFFIGALFYQLGATMAYLEAVNDGSFQGSAMKRLLDGHEADSKKMLDEKLHTFFGHVVPHHHHHNNDKDVEKLADSVDPEEGWKTKDRNSKRPAYFYPPGKTPAPRRGGLDLGAEEGTTSTYNTWRWWPTWHALRHHHMYEIGYVACSIQGFGATLYGITGIVVLPGILSSLASWQEEAAFWIPQIVASCCFLTASLLFTLETQTKWYRPEVGVLGWWIGAWATLGSIGFLLSGSFGAASFSVTYGEYQADLSSLWGSAAYLISSLLQWYEAINKRPIAELFRESGEMKSSQIHPI
ncbi:MAG: hypothetical protein M1828_005926 [Chrysothrix sp. TS-e1954]|nr:MAG: hypothetical protein M1828_005926 [Chrysothrix sp. TS-e1954]